MSFATPLGLLALLAVPAVIALHMFRRKLEPHVARPEQARKAHADYEPGRIAHEVALSRSPLSERLANR